MAFSPPWLVSVAVVVGVAVGFYGTSCRFLFLQGSAALPHPSVCLCMQLWVAGVPSGSSRIYFVTPPAWPLCRLQMHVPIAAGDQCQQR